MSDLALIRVESERAKAQLQLQVARAAAFVIYDEKSFKLAEEYTKEAKMIHDALEAKRDEIIEPLQKVIKAARADVKPRLDTALQIEMILKQKCVEYRAKLAQLKAEAEAKARALLQDVNAPVQEKREALTAMNSLQPSKTSGVTYPKRIVATVVDPSKLPEKYWFRQWSQAAVDLDVANGVRDIPGVEIKEVETMTVNWRK